MNSCIRSASRSEIVSAQTIQVSRGMAETPHSSPDFTRRTTTESSALPKGTRSKKWRSVDSGPPSASSTHRTRRVLPEAGTTNRRLSNTQSSPVSSIPRIAVSGAGNGNTMLCPAGTVHSNAIGSIRFPFSPNQFRRNRSRSDPGSFVTRTRHLPAFSDSSSARISKNALPL